MSEENCEHLDNYIVYDCDSAESGYENIIEQDNEEEYMEIEQLEDEEIEEEHIQQFKVEVETDTNEFLDINEPINSLEIKIEQVAETELNGTPDAAPPPPKKVKLDKKRPERYLLFDDLVATIVGYDETDNTPLVQFAVCSTPFDERLPIECGICPDVMPRSKLPAHLKTHLVPGTNRYKCTYCSETYKDYKYLASHARRHMGIRPYVCETCKLYFSTKQDMRVHNQRRHEKKEHICEMCGKTFAQNTMLKRHRESTHEKKRRFQCDHCPKAYYKNFSLQEHIRSVHMGQKRMLKCPFCGMQCLDAHKMARHRKFWHLNQSHYECEICDEKFTNVHYFDAHKRSIQCRENTRKYEDAKEREEKTMEMGKSEVNSDADADADADADDIVWQFKDEPDTNGNKIYENNEQLVEFVLPNESTIVEEEIEEIYEQDGNVLFQITLDSNKNN